MRQTNKSYNASAIEWIAITEHYAPMTMAPSSKIFKTTKLKNIHIYIICSMCMHVRTRACMCVCVHACAHIYTHAFINRTSDTNSIPPIQNTHAPT